MPSLLEATPEPGASSTAGPEQQRPPSAPGGRKEPYRRRRQHPVAGAMALHISKLRGITDPVRSRLKPIFDTGI